MKKNSLMLLTAVCPLLVMGQGIYPYNKLDQKLKSITPATIIEPITDAQPIEETPLTYLEGTLPKRSAKNADIDLARSINALVIENDTKNLAEVTSDVNVFDSTLIAIRLLNRFSDSAFYAAAHQLFQSEPLFNKIYQESRKNDSLLTIQYQEKLDSLKFLRRSLEHSLNNFRRDTGIVKDPYELFHYKTTMTELKKEIAPVITFLKNQKRLIAENRMLLYQEADKSNRNKKSLNEANTVPSVLNGFSDTYFIPTINVLAQRIVQKENTGTMYGATLFLSAEQASKDSSENPDFRKNSTYSILQAEASKFGFRLNYVHSYFISDAHHNSKRLELQGQFNYLVKSLPLVKTDSAGTRQEASAGSAGFLHFKLGPELFLGEYFSFYGNINYVHCVQNVFIYQDYFLVRQQGFFFINLGLNANLAFTNDQNNFKIGLDFIINNNEIKNLYRSNDLLIPALRFTYIPNLGKTI